MESQKIRLISLLFDRESGIMTVSLIYIFLE